MAETVKYDLQTILNEKMATYIDALRRGDPEGMASVFAEDGIYVTSDTILKGRQEIAAFYQSLIQERDMKDARFTDLQIVEKEKWVVISMVIHTYNQDGQLQVTSPCLMQVVPEGDTMVIKKLAGF